MLPSWIETARDLFVAHRTKAERLRARGERLVEEIETTVAAVRGGPVPVTAQRRLEKLTARLVEVNTQLYGDARR
jgi:hypothetical protein